MAEEPASRSDPSDVNGRTIPRWTLQAGLLGVVVFSAWIKWASTSLNGRVGSVRFVDLPLARVVGLVLTVLLAGLIAAASVATFGGRARFDGAGVLVAGFAAAWIGLVVLVIENASAFAGRKLLPSSLRRATFDVGSTPAMWLAAVALASLAASFGLSPSVPVGRLSSAVRARPGLSITLGVSTAAVILLAVSRYLPWITASDGTTEGSAQGWVLPWIGPTTLVLTWAALASVVSCLVFRHPVCGLMAGFVGWSGSFVAALGVLLIRIAGSLPIPTELSGVIGAEPTLRAEAGIWLFFGASLAVVPLALVVLRCSGGAHGPGSAP